MTSFPTKGQSAGREARVTNWVVSCVSEFDPKKLIKAFKKEFACNGTVVDDPEAGQVIQLQGDQRQKIATFLSEEAGIPKQTIKIHGF